MPNELHRSFKTGRNQGRNRYNGRINRNSYHMRTGYGDRKE